MNPSSGVQARSSEHGLDADAFGSLTDTMLEGLASATGTPLSVLRRSSAESLVVLRMAGDLVLPSLRAAASCAGEEDLSALIHGPIADLVTIASRGSLSDNTLWGNVASVIESSARIIAAERPEVATRARSIATATLNLPELVDCWTGQVGQVGAVDQAFRRTSCCLVISPGGDLDSVELRCGDCVRATSAH